MTYWYEVIAPIQSGPDDFSWELLRSFENMLNAIQFAKNHPDCQLKLVLDDNGTLDTVDIPFA